MGKKAVISARNGVGDISYRSSDDKVAVVDQSGVITAMGIGEATITVRAAGDLCFESIEKGIQITVVKEDETEPETETESETETEPETNTETESQKPESKQVNLSSCTAVLPQSIYKYNGNLQRPTVIVKYGSRTLREGIDYTLTYANNINIGTGKVTITGRGTYAGVLTRNFTITVVPGEKYTYQNLLYKVNNADINGNGTVKVIGGNLALKKAAVLTIPDTVSIGGVSFKVTAIENNAFKNYTRVKKVIIGKNIMEIQEGAFSRCKALKTVSGCISVRKIAKNVFSGCTKLVTVGSSSGKVLLPKVTTIDVAAFKGCKAVKKVYLTSRSLTTIKDSAFQECINMKMISISSKKLTGIGKNAFKGCKRLNTVLLRTSKLTDRKVGRNAFKGVKFTCTFKVPSGKVKSYRKLFKAKGAGNRFLMK